MMITDPQLARIFPTLAARLRALYLPLLVSAMAEFQITSRRRACAFLAQVGHESADLKYFEEIASGAAYEGRKDLGNFQAGDGKRFKGRGPIQITGRFNYTRTGIALRLPLDTQPELLALPQHAFRASAFYWAANKLNAYADQLNLRGDPTDLTRFDKITRRINGGYNGRVERQRRYFLALAVLTEAQFAEVRLERTLDALTVPETFSTAPAPSPTAGVTATTTTTTTAPAFARAETLELPPSELSTQLTQEGSPMNKMNKFINALAGFSMLAGALAPLVSSVSPKAGGYVVLAGGIAAAVTKPAFDVAHLVAKTQR